MDLTIMTIGAISVSSIAAIVFLAVKLQSLSEECARLRIIESRLEDSILKLRADLRVQEIRANEAIKNEGIAISEAMALVDRLPHGDRRNLMLKQWEERAARATNRDPAKALPKPSPTGTIGRAVIDPLVRIAKELSGADAGAGGRNADASNKAGDVDRSVGSVQP
jgi:hypothetical protein